MGNFTQKLNETLSKQSGYFREQYKSFMTSAEWRNVEMAQEFALGLKHNRSFFSLPYFRQSLDLWRILFKSYSAARKYNSIREVLFSEYMLMSLFVTFFTTMESIPKILMSLLVFPFLPKTNSSEMQQHLADYFSDYAKKLENTPFYDHPYHDIRQDLKQKYLACQHRTWVDWFTWKMISYELICREWLSKPLRYWFHQEGNSEPATTDVLVKYQASSRESAKQELKDLILNFQNSTIKLVEDEIYAKEKIKHKDGRPYVSCYARVSVPRYLGFQAVLQQMAGKGIHLRKIAGQDHVQLKCELHSENQQGFEQQENGLKQLENLSPLFSYTDRMHPNRKICLFDASVKNLHETLSSIQQQTDVTINFIHNF